MTNKVSERLTSILEAMEDGIYIVNSDFIVEFMNGYNKSLLRVEKNIHFKE